MTLPADSTPSLALQREAPRLTNAPSGETRLGRSVLPLTCACPGKSGVVALSDGRDAFAARSLLADAAERTLDVQYYIWHDDMSGILLFDALRRAADRGVSVRLLLDDNSTKGLDTILAALNSHPNIQVRLFNPFRQRQARWLGYLTDFARLNRRMHNKSFTADGLVTIVGGRNVGDEYFDAGHEVLFVDLDVMAIGPVADDVSHDFERYWTCASVAPAEHVLPSVDAAMITSVAAAAARIEAAPEARAYVNAMAELPFVHDLLAGTLQVEWTDATLLSDDPAKGLGRASNESLLSPRLKTLLGTPTHELDIVSPYFVPGSEGVAWMADLAGQGVQIRVLTNSLEATDVPAVHAGYAKRRTQLLKSGVALFEMKRTDPMRSARDRTLTKGSAGSSGSSLHVKTFVVDRARVFVGSFNLDPRSMRLNTELGFIMASPTMAQAIAEALSIGIPDRTYTVRLGNGSSLRWVEQLDGVHVTHDREPGTRFWLRVGVAVLSVLPIEWLL